MFRNFLVFIPYGCTVKKRLQLYQQTQHVISLFSWYDFCNNSCSIKGTWRLNWVQSWSSCLVHQQARSVFSADLTCVQCFLIGCAHWRKAMYVTHTHTHAAEATSSWPLFHPWPQLFWLCMLEWSLYISRTKKRSVCVWGRERESKRACTYVCV